MIFVSKNGYHMVDIIEKAHEHKPHHGHHGQWEHKKDLDLKEQFPEDVKVPEGMKKPAAHEVALVYHAEEMRVLPPRHRDDEDSEADEDRMPTLDDDEEMMEAPR